MNRKSPETSYLIFVRETSEKKRGDPEGFEVYCRKFLTRELMDGRGGATEWLFQDGKSLSDNRSEETLEMFGEG